MMGTFPEWLSVIVAAAALGAAIWAGLISKRLFDVERERDALAQDHKEREQASGIAAWCITYRKSDNSPSPKGLLLHNSSDAPVFDIKVSSTYSRRQNEPPVDQPPLKLSVLPPGEHACLADTEFPWQFPEPTAQVEHRVGAPLRPVTNNRGWMVKAIEFTDSSGKQWLRNHQGQLLRLEQEKP